jgi:two-component system CheB/CheR fusion protein
MVDADSARLQQVFWNLLKNAAKFTPEGGRIGVSCRHEDGHVVVEVSDTGIGMEPETLSSVFDAFAQAERSITRRYGGLGLGLTISRAIVNLHDGKIEARSEGPDKGSTFTVRLPLVSIAHGKAEVSGGDVSAPQGPAPLRVLVVEDHGDTLEMMEVMLSMQGHSVTTAGDVRTALEILARGTFDIILSDVGLPDGSGLDLMRELRARGHRTPGIALSGYGQEKDIEGTRAAGFAAHVVKPAEPRLLLEAMERVVREAAPAVRNR